MSLTSKDIDRLAALSRLELSESERENMLLGLNAFFSTVEQIQQINTEGIVPMSHPVELSCEIALRLQDDVVNEVVDRENNQRSAPCVQDGFYVVPKVIE